MINLFIQNVRNIIFIKLVTSRYFYSTCAHIICALSSPLWDYRQIPLIQTLISCHCRFTCLSLIRRAGGEISPSSQAILIKTARGGRFPTKESRTHGAVLTALTRVI